MTSQTHPVAASPRRLEPEGDLYGLRLEGAMPLSRAVAAIAAAIEQVRDAGGGGLVVDAVMLALAAPLSVGDRLVFARSWAEAAQGRVRLAVVAPPALIDPERFGVVAASRFGLQSGVFETCEDALGWLRDARPR